MFDIQCLNGQSTVVDCGNSTCEHQKDSLNNHHDSQYLDAKRIIVQLLLDQSAILCNRIFV